MDGPQRRKNCFMKHIETVCNNDCRRQHLQSQSVIIVVVVIVLVLVVLVV